METFITWIVEVGVKQAAPSAVRGAILGIIGFLIAKSALLSHWGVTTLGHTTTIDWDKCGLALVAVIPALLAGLIKIVQHHGTAAINGVPQSGAIEGGR